MKFLQIPQCAVIAHYEGMPLGDKTKLMEGKDGAQLAATDLCGPLMKLEGEVSGGAREIFDCKTQAMIPKK